MCISSFLKDQEKQHVQEDPAFPGFLMVIRYSLLNTLISTASHHKSSSLYLFFSLVFYGHHNLSIWKRSSELLNCFPHTAQGMPCPLLYFCHSQNSPKFPLLRICEPTKSQKSLAVTLTHSNRKQPQTGRHNHKVSDNNHQHYPRESPRNAGNLKVICQLAILPQIQTLREDAPKTQHYFFFCLRLQGR